MKIDNSLDSYVFKSVGTKCFRGIGGGVDIDVDAEVGIGDS